jgi:hypothetical protein
MSPQSGMNDSNNKKNRRTKPTAALPMSGAIVTAALLLSGLSLISSNINYQPAIAQQNVTEGGGGGGGATTTDNTTSAIGSATQGGNATTAGAGAGAGNQSTLELRMNLEQARTALQNNDTQSATMYLDMALSAMGGGTQGNITSSTATAGGGNATTGGEEGVSVGGTSAADDYDETADANG